MRKVFRTAHNPRFCDKSEKCEPSRRSILFYSEGWGLGGIERFIMNDIEELDKQKFRFSIFCVHDWSATYDSEIGILGGTRFVVFSGRKPNLVFRLFAGLVQWAIILKSYKFDIVHINTMNGTGFLYAFVAKLFGVPIRIVHAHNSDFGLDHRKIKYVVNKLSCLFFSGCSTMNLACSRTAGLFLFGNRNFRILKNGIKINRFLFNFSHREEIRTKLKIPDSSLVIGSVARLSVTKNPLFQVRLLAAIRKKGIDSHLILIGDGELRSEVIENAERLNVRDFVHLPGTVNEPELFLSALDIFTLPSLFEGLPLSLVEATVCGLKCFVSDSVQFERSDFPNIELLPIHDLEAWVESILAVPRNNDQVDARRLIFGRDKILDEYDQRQMVSILEQIYSR